MHAGEPIRPGRPGAEGVQSGVVKLVDPVAAARHPRLRARVGRAAVPRLFLFFAAFLLGCAAPEQMGMITVAPGASERALVLMRLGFLSGGDSVGTAEVRRLAREELVPAGASASGRFGDWLLENSAMVAVVGQIDGTTRGGRLVDVWRKPNGVDGLEDHETYVFGKLVTYETLRTGFDDKTGAAYVEVSAVVDRSADGFPVVSVATRYDIAPGIDAILAHTQIKTIRGAAPEEPAVLFAERVQADGRVEASVDATTASSIGDTMGYLLHPLTVPAEIGADGTMARVAVPSTATPAVGSTFLFSRMIAPLERPDSLALAVARARIEGERVGEVRLQLFEAGKQLARLGVGDVVLRRDDGTELVARGVLPCPPESAYVVHAPEGTYALGFRGAIHGASPVGKVTIGEAGTIAERVSLSVSGVSDAYREPPRAWRCHKDKDAPPELDL